MAVVFLDLDGTLTDPFEGISLSVIHALKALDLPCPPQDSLGWVIGPALVDSFATLGASDPELALRHYRDRYTDVGLFENRVYSGVVDMMRGLITAGHTLHLATAKPHVYARKITAHYGLDTYLDQQFGPELDGTRNDKGVLLAHALQKLGQSATDCVMVGDRHHDYNAARAVGMASIAVTWGYGNAEERAIADVICERPADLAQAVESAFT